MRVGDASASVGRFVFRGFCFGNQIADRKQLFQNDLAAPIRRKGRSGQPGIRLVAVDRRDISFSFLITIIKYFKLFLPLIEEHEDSKNFSFIVSINTLSFNREIKFLKL